MSSKAHQHALGLLGLGSRSTLFYLHQLNGYYQQQHGGYSTCPLVLLNTNFDQINPFLPNQFEQLEPVLQRHLKTLASLNIAKVIIPNITLHECYERLAEKNSALWVDCVNPVTETIKQLKADKRTTIVLFGSAYSMQSELLHQKFKDAGIDIILPEKEDRESIDTIRQLIYNSEEQDRDLQFFQLLIEKYDVQSPIVIACTELSIPIIDSSNVYDMAKIQIQQALQPLLT